MVRRQKDSQNQDPFAEREAQTYDNPIPSREFILSILAELGRPLKHEQLCRELNLTDADGVEALRRRLNAMERDGQLIETRGGGYGLVDRMNLVAGRVIGHRDGFGFLVADEGGEDIFLHNRQMRKVLDGDRVLVQPGETDRRGRVEGRIVEVLEHNTKQLVGRIYRQGNVCNLEPENARINLDILIAPEDSQGAEDGYYVLAEIIQQPGQRRIPRARVVEVLGAHMAPGMEIEVAIRNYEIPSEWPENVSAEAQRYGASVDEADKQGRVDLRRLPFVTIDGEDARDFDDAVLCEAKKSGGWRLYVAIADVSHYVKPNSALDQEAYNRGNSVYFPEYVVPMLPESLSNGLCSLNPHVDRLAMVCEMTISTSGAISGYRFYEGVICSQARLTYTEVGAMLSEPDSDLGKQVLAEHAAVVSHVKELHNLYHTLLEARRQRGAIEFETTETRIIFGAERKIEQIVPVTRNDAHKLIEECMLCANVATARFLEKSKKPALYRVHNGPKEKKLEGLHAYLGELGLSLPGREKPEPGDYQELLQQIAERPDAHIISTMMLRSMSQAVYTPENEGHFGLGYPAYAHFTSPIRRYPDLLNHRLIRAHIRNPEVAQGDMASRIKVEPGTPVEVFGKSYPYDDKQMAELGEHCSMAERRADDATRDVVAWLKCEYMQNCIGDEFEGVISAVTGFGVFIELKGIFVEGLIHISGLEGDYYVFDAAKQRLIGERTRTVYKLGDELKVRVARVDLDDRKIDFELIGSVTSKQKKPSVREALAAGRIPGGKGASSESERTPSKRKPRGAAADNKPGAKRSAAGKKGAGGQGAGEKKAASKSAASKTKKPGAKKATRKRR